MKAVPGVLLLFSLVWSGIAAESVPFREWSVQIPERLTLNPSESSSPFLPLKEFLTRSCQEMLRRVKGGVIRYRIIPENVSPVEQVLEFEYPMTVKAVYGDGRLLKDVSSGNPGRLWPSADVGRCFLLSPGTRKIEYDVYDFPVRFPNHTGEVKIRPVKFADTFSVTQKITDLPDKFHVEVTIAPRTGKPLSGTLVLRVYDYFGSLLRERKESVNLSSGSLTVTEKPSSPDDYKLVTEFHSRSGERSLPYWSYFRTAGRDSRLLDWGWSAKWVPGNKGFALPPEENGWFSDFPKNPRHVPPGLPYFRSNSLKTHRIWLRNRFTLPEDWGGSRIVLALNSIGSHGRFYVNGQFIGEKYNRDLPGELDITSALKPGKNELLIGVTDYIVLKDPADGAVPDGVYPDTGNVDAGPFQKRFVILGLTDTPRLRKLGPARFDSVVLQTLFSGERKLLKGSFRLKNSSGKPESFRVSCEVFERGRKILDVFRGTLSCDSSGNAVQSFTKEFPNAKLWDFRSPNLYEFRLTASGEKNVSVRESVRFGFREWKTKGRDFFLNGRKVSLFGDSASTLNSWSPHAFLWPVRPTNCRVARGGKLDCPWTGRELDICDEIGMATTMEMNVSPYGRANAFRMGNPLLYRNLSRKWERVIPVYRNHPSIFANVLGNEPPTENPEWCRRMAGLEQFVRKLDPTRFAFFSRGNDLGGLSPLYVPHYLYHIHIFPTDLNLFDSTAADRRLKKQMLHKDSYERIHLRRDNSKPVFDSEGASVTDGRTFAWKFGESILVRHPSDRWESTGYRLCMEAMRAYIYECYRKNDLSVLAHIGCRIGEDALSDVAAFLMEEEYHLSSGKSSARTVKVMNDSSAEEEILVEFRLLRENGAVARNLSRTFLLPPGGRTDWIVELPGIPVSKPEFATVLLSATGKRSGARYRKQIPFTVFPELKMSFPQTVLFDPVGESAAAFAASGIRIPLIRSLKDAGKGKVLVIGRNALAKADSETLNALVAGGLRVLVLQQNDFTWGFPFEVADGNFASDGTGAVIASPRHPVFRGILEEDLRYWQNRDRVPVVFENAPLTPSSARVKSLLIGSKTAFTGDMHYSPLFEGRHGKGVYLVSALAFTDSLPFDPAARLFFRNLLQYLSASLVTPGRGAIAADRADWNRLRNRFGMNAADNAFRKDRTESMILWNPAEPVSPELVRMVKNGGTLYLRVPDASRLKEVERIFGFRVGFSAHVSEFAAMTVRDPLFEGLTQQDFIWGKNIQNGGRPPDPKHLLGTQVFVSAQKGFSPLLLPAYLAEFPYGKGRVILDSTRLNEMNSREAYAVTGTIFRNLGLNLSWKPKQEKAFHVPDGIFEFHPLDPSASANLSFSDEFPGDRKGGWIDGGRLNDLRMLPRGNNRFCGIPVSIPPKAVSVKGAVWKQLPVKAVEIPVHRSLDKIYFFHTCGYASLKKGEPMAQYVIYYEDRADWIPGKPDPFVKVPVRNQLHIQDWWFYDRIAKGELAMPDARIGWRGEKTNANRGIAVMEWENPFPERKIAAVQLESLSDKAQFFLIAATGAVYRKENVIKPEVVRTPELPSSLQSYKRLFLVRAGSLLCYLDGAAIVRGIFRKDGTPLFGEFASWLLQYRTDRFHNVQEYGNIPSLRCTRDGDTTVLELKPQSGKWMDWSRTIRFSPERIQVEFRFRFRETFSEIAASAGFIGLNGIFSLPSGESVRPGKMDSGHVELHTGKTDYTFSFDPDSLRMAGEWNFDRRKNSLRIAPETFSRQKVTIGKEYRLLLEIKNAPERKPLPEK